MEDGLCCEHGGYLFVQQDTSAPGLAVSTSDVATTSNEINWLSSTSLAQMLYLCRQVFLHAGEVSGAPAIVTLLQ
jgi:hypothetical protein